MWSFLVSEFQMDILRKAGKYFWAMTHAIISKKNDLKVPTHKGKIISYKRLLIR